ncbi:CAP domain-containing protein [Hysterangium stoloniferum]|nr:CAP domain-containing protein [Hysterangium stoloniferum]
MTKLFIAASVLIALVSGGHAIDRSGRRGHARRAAFIAGRQDGVPPVLPGWDPRSTNSTPCHTRPPHTEPSPPLTSPTLSDPASKPSDPLSSPPASSPSPLPPVRLAGASDNSSGTTSAGDIALYLSEHNTVRVAHNASLLTWSQSLAASAQNWVNQCQGGHSQSDGKYGENVAEGTGDGYGIKEAIAGWAEEVSNYNPKNPVASHWTQMVWKSTKEIGCAVNDCSGLFPAEFGLAHFYTCQYYPPGNYNDEYDANVVL